VIVTVTDGELSDHHLVNLIVNNKNRPPIALGGRNRTVTTGEAVHLDASLSFDPDYDISSSGAPAGVLTYLWDFGDGEMGQGKSVSHSYEKAGSYVVTLTVTDDEMASGNFTLIITVTRDDNFSGFPVLLAMGLIVLIVTPIIIIVVISRRRREKEMNALMWQKASKDKRVRRKKKIKRVRLRKVALSDGEDREKPENGHM